MAADTGAPEGAKRPDSEFKIGLWGCPEECKPDTFLLGTSWIENSEPASSVQSFTAEPTFCGVHPLVSSLSPQSSS